MTPDQARSAYRRALGGVGETVYIRRYNGPAGNDRTYYDTAVFARVVGFDAQNLIAAAQQGERKLIVLGEDLESSGITLPLRKGDKAIVRDRVLDIEAPDDNSRRLGGELIAYEIRVRG